MTGLPLSTGWIVAISAVAVFALARALFDVRAKRYVWGVLGALAAAVLFCAPVVKYTVTFTVPAPDQR